MTDTRTALKNGLNMDTNKESVENTIVASSVEISKTEDLPSETQETKPVKKKERGRPVVNHKITKIHLILQRRGITRKDFFNLIKKKYPDEPISPDALSRIVSGKRQYYSTTTLFRICGALNVTPNQVLDYEEEII